MGCVGRNLVGQPDLDELSDADRAALLHISLPRSMNQAEDLTSCRRSTRSEPVRAAHIG